MACISTARLALASRLRARAERSARLPDQLGNSGAQLQSASLALYRLAASRVSRAGCTRARLASLALQVIDLFPGKAQLAESKKFVRLEHLHGRTVAVVCAQHDTTWDSALDRQIATRLVRGAESRSTKGKRRKARRPVLMASEECVAVRQARPGAGMGSAWATVVRHLSRETHRQDRLISIATHSSMPCLACLPCPWRVLHLVGALRVALTSVSAAAYSLRAGDTKLAVHSFKKQ